MLDVLARRIRKPDASAPPLRQSEIGVPFGYTNSLEDLIKGGKQYGTIYLLPPWPSDQIGPQGSFFYRKPISKDILASMPIRQLAAPSCNLFLWAPDQFLADAIRVIDAWGFTYHGSLIWKEPGDEATVQGFLLHGVHSDSPPKACQGSWVVDSRALAASGLSMCHIESLIQPVSPPPRLRLFNEIVDAGWISWGQHTPRPFDPDEEDEEDDWGPGEDEVADDELGESEALAKPEGLVADSPLILDVAIEKTSRPVRP